MILADETWTPPPARALSAPEREAVLDVLHSERFVDVSPEETWATLLDEGTYLCSTRTMYRILAAKHGGVRERRAQLTHPAYAKPELLAERPNELGSWDVSKLKGPAKAPRPRGCGMSARPTAPVPRIALPVTIYSCQTTTKRPRRRWRAPGPGPRRQKLHEHAQA
jgi:hypothetical protein